MRFPAKTALFKLENAVFHRLCCFISIFFIPKNSETVHFQSFLNIKARKSEIGQPTPWCSPAFVAPMRWSRLPKAICIKSLANATWCKSSQKSQKRMNCKLPRVSGEKLIFSSINFYFNKLHVYGRFSALQAPPETGFSTFDCKFR